jgi:hypothetical protein
MSTTQKPRIFQDGETISPFDTFETVELSPSQFRSGMVLVDPELGTAVYSLDHRVRAARNSGSVRWLVEDLEGSGWVERSFAPNVKVPVAL